MVRMNVELVVNVCELPITVMVYDIIATPSFIKYSDEPVSKSSSKKKLNSGGFNEASKLTTVSMFESSTLYV